MPAGSVCPTAGGLPSAPPSQRKKSILAVALAASLPQASASSDSGANLTSIRASCLLRMNIQRKPGDWNCKNCQHLNFGRRDYCQRCHDPRPDLQFSDGYSTGGVLTSLDIRPGDWYCSCGYHNFASRSSCFKCGTIVRDFPAGQGAAGAEGDFACGRDSAAVRAGWKAGDWICTRPGCNVHNFASRTECYRCNAPREAGTYAFFSFQLRLL
ncbi:hypothetical protein BAE44_0017577 [Dichanthelium oligosanthes]|uniref:RanBP2-type domain-containing protein n=1 Tax=Dichanthelium oligosanthes TaxID=888268 RepID=A0A1E5V8S8_9POAL|nr:hypothetical protein BAE44_0017577 [Dichanthelium oligosanthes]